MYGLACLFHRLEFRSECQDEHNNQKMNEWPKWCRIISAVKCQDCVMLRGTQQHCVTWSKWLLHFTFAVENFTATECPPLLYLPPFNSHKYDYIYIYIYIKASVPSWCISHLRYYNGDLISLIRICEISHSTNIKIGYVNISQTLLDSREHFLTLCSTVLGTVLPKHCRTFSKLSNHDIWWDLSHPGAQRPLFVAVKSQFQTKVLLLLPMCSHFQTEFRCSS